MQFPRVWTSGAQHHVPCAVAGDANPLVARINAIIAIIIASRTWADSTRIDPGQHEMRSFRRSEKRG